MDLAERKRSCRNARSIELVLIHDAAHRMGGGQGKGKRKTGMDGESSLQDM